MSGGPETVTKWMALVRWPRKQTSKEVEKWCKSFHWLVSLMSERTQRPLDIEWSSKEMQWNNILVKVFLKISLCLIVVFSDGIPWWYSMLFDNCKWYLTVVVFNAMKALFRIDDLRGIGETTAKYYYWKYSLHWRIVWKPYRVLIVTL